MLLDALMQVQDPRIERTKKYPLIEILFSTIFAIMDGARSWSQISTFAYANLDKMRKFLPFENGIPIDDTYNRVFQAIDPNSLEQAFRRFAQHLLGSLGHDVSLINIDGKQMRGATDAGSVTVHILSAWCHDCGISLGQLKVADKSNEITAIPELLDVLHLEGAMITIDAMGTQKGIAKQIDDQKGYYLLALKGNQGKLSESAQQVASNCVPIDTYEAEPESAKGYVYERMARVFTVTKKRVPTAGEWQGLTRIVQISSYRTHKATKVVTEDIRFYITNDKTFTAEQYLNATRNHWDIENGCHWQLDVTFKEDASRKHAGFAAENFSRILRLCLNCVKSLDFGPRNKECMINKCKLTISSEVLMSQLLYGIAASN